MRHEDGDRWVGKMRNEAREEGLVWISPETEVQDGDL
jgi:hypothetical protein